MDTLPNQQWYLLKHENGEIFGPLDFEQVKRWAASAQIAPHDKLSTDQQTWMKAPMFPELAMDWLVEVTNDRYYGPTTLGALAEFLQDEELTPDTYVINSCDGARVQLSELQEQLDAQRASVENNGETPGIESPSSIEDAPTSSVETIELQERIRDLEQTLAEERSALREAERRYEILAARYSELISSEAPPALRE